VSTRLRNPLRVVRDADGQVLLLVAILMTAVLAFMLVIPNGTQVTTQKMSAQTAADAGAFTGSVWLARALNLNANMNTGIRSMYTWMTVLTASQALALALYSDSLDPSVQGIGQGLTLALFGNSNPVLTASTLYPQSILKLKEAAQWLYDLQSDIAASFPAVAQSVGAAQACRNVSGGNASAQNPGGAVLVRTGDTLLVPTRTGDSLFILNMRELAAALDTIPTCDSNVGAATGRITIDSTDLEVKAYYGDSSNWCSVVQVLAYRDYIVQHYKTAAGQRESATKFFRKPGGKDWADVKLFRYWLNDSLPRPPWLKDYENHGNNRYKRDTIRTRQRVIKVNDPRWNTVRGYWTYSPWHSGDSILESAQPLVDSGCFVDSSYLVRTGFYTGAESTNHVQGARLRPRRLNLGQDLHAVAYVWRLGEDGEPLGPSPTVGRSLFPRNRVAASFPMLAIARSQPFLAKENPTEADYFFAPQWDVRLTPVDSAGVNDISNDPTYRSLGLDSLDLEALRRYVLLP
jgi:hypothetical protein